MGERMPQNSPRSTKPPATPAERRRRNREEVENAILDISRGIMREHGAAALNLNEVARQLGMKTPSLYEYFPNKMAIYDALFRLGFGLFGERMSDAVRQDLPIWERFGAAIESYMAFAQENPELYQIMFERPVPGFEPSEASMQESLATLHRASTALTQAIEAAEIEPGLPLEQARDLRIAMMHGLTALHMANEPQLPVGSGRFGSLIPAAVNLFRLAWGIGRPEDEK